MRRFLVESCRAEATHFLAILPFWAFGFLAPPEVIVAATEPLPEPGEDVGRIFREMEEAIDRADPEAITRALQIIRRHAAAGSLPQPDLLSTLEQQINRYDYDQAKSTLQQMQRSGEM